MALVDQLLVAARREERPAGRYDELRGLTLDADGRPLVAETRRITEFPGERDEPAPSPPPPSRPDSDDDPQIETVRTFVEREVDEASATPHVYVTRTDTYVRREQPDHNGADVARVYFTRTETTIAREQPDYDGWSSERDAG